MRRSAKIASGFLLTASMLVGLHQTAALQPVNRFFAYYQAVQQAAPLDFWQRVAASVLLTRAECRALKAQATCSRTSSL